MNTAIAIAALERQVRIRAYWDNPAMVEAAAQVAYRTIGFHRLQESLPLSQLSLMSGNVYGWSTGVTLLAHQVASKLVSDLTFRPEHVPTPDGYWWLETPVRQQRDDEAESAIEAISWITVARREGGFLALAPGNKYVDPVPGDDDEVAFTFWHRYNVGGVIAVLPAIFLIPMNRDGTERLLEEAIQPDWTLWRLRFVYSCLQLIRQKILIPQAEALPRAVRRRIPEGQDPRVSVIVLRHQHHHGHHDVRDVDWAYQWAVKGHWRNQWYRAKKQHGMKWIAPYVKGPVDKPFKATPSLYAVIR